MKTRLGFLIGSASVGAFVCLVDGRLFSAAFLALAAIACLALAFRQTAEAVGELISCTPMVAGPDGWCEWVHPLPGYLMQCCDCGLVHDVEFEIVPRADNAELNPGEHDGAVIIFRMRRHDG